MLDLHSNQRPVDGMQTRAACSSCLSLARLESRLRWLQLHASIDWETSCTDKERQWSTTHVHSSNQLPLQLLSVSFHRLLPTDAPLAGRVHSKTNTQQHATSALVACWTARPGRVRGERRQQSCHGAPRPSIQLQQQPLPRCHPAWRRCKCDWLLLIPPSATTTSKADRVNCKRQ